MVYKSKYALSQTPQTGILHFLFSNKYNTPQDKPILIDSHDPSRFITYSQLKDLVFQFAAGLQDMCDFQSDDVLLLYASNTYNYAVPFFGAVAANGVVSPANPNYNKQELVYQLEQTKAKIIICEKSNLKTALAAAHAVNIPRERMFIFGDQAVDGIQPFQKVLLGDRRASIVDLSYEEAKEKTAYMCFSSGTTGKSKGVITTHTNIASNIAQYDSFDERFINKETTRILSVLPLFHIFGIISCLHMSVYWGVPVYFAPRFEITNFCQTIEKHKITYIILVPPILLALIKTPVVDRYDLSSLSLVVSGAAPLHADLIQAVTAKFPKMILKQAYGLTETSPCAIIEPTDHVISGSIGVLVPNMLAKVVDDDDKEVPSGERGELCLKGPNLMKGYVNNPMATADCIDSDGWFHTGDVVVVDKDEHFYIVDRKKELIKFKGFQVPPAELEGILLSLPMINDCAVLGLYDERQATEIPVAFVVLKENIRASQKLSSSIMKFVADQVVPYKQIRKLRFIDSIPKNPSGKILRRVLRDQMIIESDKKASL